MAAPDDLAMLCAQVEGLAAPDDLAMLCAQVEGLAVRASELRLDALSRGVVDAIGVIVADTVGVAAGGGRAPEMRALFAEEPFRTLCRRTDAGAVASVLVEPGYHADAATAAWANGTAATFLELDEGVRPTGHPAAHLVPAALAAAQTERASGRTLVEAVAAGYEVTARLFDAFTLPAAMHPHGHFGAIGAAVAVARIHGVDPIPAVRIAATQPLLTGWDACYVGATARNSWPGHANRVGVLAHAMARAGFTGATESFMSLVAGHRNGSSALDDRVDGDRLRMLENYFKLHSACALTQGGVDAVLDLAATGDIPDPAEIRAVEVSTVRSNLRVARQAERNALSTRFSLPYVVATALVHGRAGPSEMTWRSDVAELADRVSVHHDATFDAGWPDTAVTKVRVTTGQGTVERTVANPRGHHANPASRADLEDKFVTLVGGSPARARETFGVLSDLASVPDCAELPLPFHEENGEPR